MSLTEALANAWLMLQWMAFFALFFVLWAFVCVVLIDAVSARVRSEGLKRTFGGTVAGLITWYAIAGIGWYISLGAAASAFSIILAVIAGAWWLPNRSRTEVTAAANA